MRQIINSATITHRVQGWLTSSQSARILHVFDEACNLINERREILSVVTQEIGHGPFNLLVENEINFRHHLTAHSPVAATLTELHLGDLTLRWHGAKLWNPRPDWRLLHSQIDYLAKQLNQLQVTKYLDTSAHASNTTYTPMLQSSSSLTSALAIADLSSSITAAKRLAGSGIGLTPSGDDFLIGAIYAAWIIHPHEVAERISAAIADAAAPLTTSLSGAWLRAASKGEAGILWHTFFDALVSGQIDAVKQQISQILSVGATSGADALAGFVQTLGTFKEIENKHVVP